LKGSESPFQKSTGVNHKASEGPLSMVAVYLLKELLRVDLRINLRVDFRVDFEGVFRAG
jgi:hypothetical protein